MAAGVYYLETPVGAGPLYLEDPRVIPARATTGLDDDESEGVDSDESYIMMTNGESARSTFTKGEGHQGIEGMLPVAPQAGRVVIFPGWLQHKVAPTPPGARGARIALSFNLRGRWDATGSRISLAHGLPRAPLGR